MRAYWWYIGENLARGDICGEDLTVLVGCVSAGAGATVGAKKDGRIVVEGRESALCTRYGGCLSGPDLQVSRQAASVGSEVRM